MTLRRLNIRIQGFPESYATEPYMSDSMVVGEPASSLHSPMSQPKIHNHKSIVRPIDEEQRSTHETHNHESLLHSNISLGRDAAVGDGNLRDIPQESGDV